MTRVLVLYYSSYGHVRALAQAEAEGARSVPGTHVDLRRVPETVPDEVRQKAGFATDDTPIASPEELEAYDAIIFGTPTLGSLQAMIVILMARGWLGTPIRAGAVAAAAAGVLGVALLLIGPDAALDPVGIAAGLGGAASMAAGTVLTRKWQPPVSALSFTAWQLTAGGLILLPLALIMEPALPPLTATNLAGLVWLGLIGAAATYALWFRGVARLESGAVSMLGMMSPVTAVLLGWVMLGQSLSPLQGLGAVIVLGSVWAGQRANRPSTDTTLMLSNTSPAKAA